MLICAGKMWIFFCGEFSSFFESSTSMNCSHWKHECVVCFYILGNAYLFWKNMEFCFRGDFSVFIELSTNMNCSQWKCLYVLAKFGIFVFVVTSLYLLNRQIALNRSMNVLCVFIVLEMLVCFILNNS